MAWWKVRKEPEIMVGDDSYLHAVDFLKRLSELYQEDLGRQPALAEVLYGLQEALLYNAHELLKDCAELDVKELIAKTTKRKKRQPFALGDYFAIPLRNGEHGFGRILWQSWGHLIAVFDVTAKTMKHPRKLENAKVLFSVFVSPEAWEEWRWRILGGKEGYKLDKSKLPSFGMGDEISGWRITTAGKERSASEKEVSGLESAQLWPPERIAWRIEALKGIVTAKDVVAMLARGKKLHKAGNYKAASAEAGLAAQYAKWIVPGSAELTSLRDEGLRIVNDCIKRLGYA